MRKPLRLLLLSSGGLLLVGCAMIPKNMNVQLPPGVNPDSGPAVKIVSATDRRVFTEQYTARAENLVKPEWIGDTNVTDRLIGRVPGSSQVTYYAGVFVSKGDTVASLASHAVARGLQRSGYRVLVAGESGFDVAIPLEVFVDSFWVTLDRTPLFKARVVVKGPVPPFIGGVAVRSTKLGKNKNFFNPIQTTTSNFKPTVREGLRNLEEAVATRFK